MGYLGAFVATAVALASAILTYAHFSRAAQDHQRRRLEYDALISRLPDACRLEDMQKRVADRQAELDRLGRDLAFAQVTIEEKKQASEWLSQNRIELDTGKQQLERLRIESTELERQVRQRESDLEDRQNELAQTIANLREAKQEADAVNASTERLRRTTKDLADTEAQQRARIDKLKTQGDGLNADVALRTAQIGAANQEFDRQNQENARLRQELADLRQRLGAAEARMATVAASHAAEEATVQALLGQKKDLYDDVRLAQSSTHAARLALEKAKREEIDKTAQVTHLQESIAATQKAVLAEEAKVERLNRQARTSEERAHVLQQEQVKLKTEIDSLRVERTGLEQSMASLRATHESTLEQLRQTGQLGSEADKELWQPVLGRRTGKNTPDDEAQALADVHGQLLRQGLVFSERTLRAFHTSLKVSEMSPLVVLAGISGTGKSELPRRYAEAIGMQCLAIPVQPRWDSPQDLFGFYNYLEGRFRPTELTRALIQMDRLWKEQNRGWNPPKGWNGSVASDVLLVLLDEMNLARVEYYFSEFLSKLEIRRGVLRDQPDDRSKAELVLEVGRRNEGSASMRLFADTNVLFVGTMNEDESTQTLSDKVVDRANVMRFGKPNLLRSKVSVDTKQATPPRRLTYDTWRKWTRDESSLGARGSGQLVDGWIARLNNAMEKIGRPFAHRTHQAIRAYLANYPQPDDDGLRCAMSDQIEQRILPKFKGLDPSEPAVLQALDGVRKLIQDLRDPQLQSSVDAACHSQHSHQFNWRGVDRAVENAPIG